MISVYKNDISLTRGDTLLLRVFLENKDGSKRTLEGGDSLRFALKKSYRDNRCLVIKPIPTDTMLLELEPLDTKNLQFGRYDYDIELTDSEGHVSTPIIGSLTLTKEVH